MAHAGGNLMTPWNFGSTLWGGTPARNTFSPPYRPVQPAIPFVPTHFPTPPGSVYRSPPFVPIHRSATPNVFQLQQLNPATRTVSGGGGLSTAIRFGAKQVLPKAVPGINIASTALSAAQIGTWIWDKTHQPAPPPHRPLFPPLPRTPPTGSPFDGVKGFN